MDDFLVVLFFIIKVFWNILEVFVSLFFLQVINFYFDDIYMLKAFPPTHENNNFYPIIYRYER